MLFFLLSYAVLWLETKDTASMVSAQFAQNGLKRNYTRDCHLKIWGLEGRYQSVLIWAIFNKTEIAVLIYITIEDPYIRYCNRIISSDLFDKHDYFPLAVHIFLLFHINNHHDIAHIDFPILIVAIPISLLQHIQYRSVSNIDFSMLRPISCWLQIRPIIYMHKLHKLFRCGLYPLSR